MGVASLTLHVLDNFQYLFTVNSLKFKLSLVIFGREEIFEIFLRFFDLVFEFSRHSSKEIINLSGFVLQVIIQIIGDIIIISVLVAIFFPGIACRLETFNDLHNGVTSSTV